MADREWDYGAVTRNLGTAANWTADTAPVSNDRVFFTSNVTGAGTGPNTNMAALTAVDADLVEVTGEYTESVGQNGSSMDISADRVNMYGQATLYLKDGGGTTDHVFVDVDRRAVFTASTGTVSLQISGATTSFLSIRRGRVDTEGTCTITDILLGMEGLVNPEVFLNIAAGNTITTATMHGGVVASNTAPSGAVKVHGGTWTQSTVVLAGALWVFPGARVNLTVTGTYPTVYWFGGIIDGSKGGPKVITNLYQMFQNESDANRLIGFPTLVTVTNRL